MTLRSALEWIGVAVGAVLLWMVMQKPHPGPVERPQEAIKAPELSSIPKTEIKPPKVIVYAPAAKKKLNLPAEVQNDPVLAILDSSKIPDSDHSQTITTVINSDTGEAKSYVTTNPYPLIAAENSKNASIAYGISNAGRWIGRISFTDDLVQIKAIHFGITTAFDTDGRYFIGGSISYRF